MDINFCGICLRLWSRNSKQDSALLSSLITQQRLFLGLGPSSYRTVSQLLVHITSSLPTYCTTAQALIQPQDLFTEGWPTVVLPLQAQVQPESTLCLDVNSLVGWFWWPNFHSSFLASLPVSPVVLWSQTWLCWPVQSSALRGGTTGRTYWCL